MITRISILCANDSVWSLPCWDRTLAHLRAHGVVVDEFIVTDYKPSVGRVKEPPYLWYIKRFGLWNFGLMAAFAVMSRIASCVTGAPQDYEALCKKHGITIRKIASVKDAALLEHFRQNPPGIVAIMVPEIIPAALIACCKGGMVNQHPSLLPKYRGLFPYIPAATRGDAQGVTLHRIDAQIDAGDILHQYRFTTDEAASMVRAHAGMMWRYPQALLAAIRGIEDKTTVVRITSGAEESEYFSTPDAQAMHAFFKAGGKIIRLRDLALAWRNGYAMGAANT